MKKGLTILIIFIFSITGIFAYSPTLKDTEISKYIDIKLNKNEALKEENSKIIVTKVSD